MTVTIVPSHPRIDRVFLSEALAHSLGLPTEVESLVAIELAAVATDLTEDERSALAAVLDAGLDAMGECPNSEQWAEAADTLRGARS